MALCYLDYVEEEETDPTYLDVNPTCARGRSRSGGIDALHPVGPHMDGHEEWSGWRG